MPIIYLNKQAVCLETVHVNKPASPKGSVRVSIKPWSPSSDAHIHLAPFLQIKAQRTQACWLETSSAQTNKSYQAKGNWDPSPIPAFIQQNHLWAQLPGNPPPPNISFSFPEEEEIWSLSGRQVWCNRRLRNLGRLLLATPCQAHKEKNRTIRHGWESLIQSGAN